MSFVKKARYGDGYIWKCPNKQCNKEVSIRKGTFFEGSHLSIATIIRFTYYWAYEMDSTATLQRELRIANDATVDWKNFLRDICAQFYEHHPRQIGGMNKTVEIDECMLVRRKYHVGHTVNRQWVFGGYEINSRKVFLQAVPNRTADTLLQAIVTNIAPGSTIVSDCWASYGGIGTLQQQYQHLTVNHENHFVDPITFSTTNHIESVWQKLKSAHKKHYGTHRTLLDSYLAEFVWRYEFGSNPYSNIIKHIKIIYPQ
ncbi:uncharacterized protein DEA37_0003830 [Paragonimus westermani]|uniref:ISXO2-like transposase domain-containing protein n=1 Tax=Paragonimus westermani TaxID=34504 RepID=A0A5J4N4J4_9TREM|nr:uncharacterized protein DEA37_0003830 [Paragonimus westermani]